MKLSVLGCCGVGTTGETTCFLLDIADKTFLIDAGLAPARQMTAIKRVLPEVSHVFISHVHADHLQGLPYALFAREIQARSRPNTGMVKVLSHSAAIASAKTVCELLYPDRTLAAEWTELGAGESITIDDTVTVKTLAVNHTVPCFAYRFDTVGESLTFSGDTLPSDELVDFARGSSVLIHEAFGTEADFAKVSPVLKHSLGTHAGQTASSAGVSNLVLFHMHERYMTSNDDRDRLIAEVKQSYAGNVVFPQDLDVLELRESRLVTARQVL